MVNWLTFSTCDETLRDLELNCCKTDPPAIVEQENSKNVETVGLATHVKWSPLEKKKDENKEK